ncbi:MAG TPA: hypothetical protein VL947_04720 [Cytophagales bacterium]|nr:hypothetical protein [Cytophagales bacterium]
MASQALIYVELMRQGVFPEAHPMFMWMLVFQDFGTLECQLRDSWSGG